MPQILELPVEIITNTLVRVNYRDTDKMGVVYYANYAVWFEIGRVEFLRRCGMAYKDLEKNGIILPVKHFSCDYFKSARYDDIIRIETNLKELTKISVSFNYNIYHYPSNELLASGETTHVFINDQGKIQRAGEIILQILAKCDKEKIEECKIPRGNI